MSGERVDYACTHRHNEERDQGVPWATPIGSKMGSIRSKIGDKMTKMGPFGVLSFMKITLESPSLDQKEQNCFGNPQFYSSIAPMPVLTNSDKNQPKNII